MAPLRAQVEELQRSSAAAAERLQAERARDLTLAHSKLSTLRTAATRSVAAAVAVQEKSQAVRATIGTTRDPVLRAEVGATLAGFMTFLRASMHEVGEAHWLCVGGLEGSARRAGPSCERREDGETLCG